MIQTSPDLNFGVLKKKLKRTEANCLKDLASAVQESSVTNNAKLCGLEDGIEANTNVRLEGVSQRWPPNNQDH